MSKRLLWQKGCPHCPTAKSMLASLIDAGEVTLTEVTDDSPVLDQNIADKFGGIPTLVEETEERVCEINIETGERLKCLPRKELEGE